jgi:hypothetical protein
MGIAMQRSKWRWIKRIGIAAAALVLLGVASVPFVVPALAAYTCPSCYGLERVTPTLYVEAAMPAPDRAALQDTIAAAEAGVAAFYGTFGERPTLLACMTEDCDRRLGGRGARATAYTTFFGTFIRAAPRGLNETILSHEFSHAELHGRIGAWKLLMEAVPAWFDEGVAVIVSGDGRYLKQGVAGARGCTAEPDGQMPESHFKWGAASGKTPGLYAKAACAVLIWMDANGGRPGLLAALREAAEGKRTLP